MIITPNPARAVLSLTNDTLIATYYAGAVYKWYRNGVLVPTATTNIYTPATNGIYTVEYSINGCNAPLSIPYTVSGSSVYTATQQQLMIYPNPVIDEVVINTGQTIHQILLVDAFGRKAYESKGLNTKQLTIRMSDFPPGAYGLLISGPTFNYKTMLLKVAHL